MQGERDACLLMHRRLIGNGVGAERRNLHLVEPLHEFLAVGETRLDKGPLVEFGGTLFKEAGQEARSEDENIVFLDRHTLLACDIEELGQVDHLALVHGIDATIAGSIEKDAASNDAALAEGIDAILFHAAHRGRSIVAVPDLVVVPGMSQSVVLGRSLQEHDHEVVSVLESSIEGCQLAADIVALILRHQTLGRSAARPDGIAALAADGHTQGNDLPLFHALDAAQDLSGRQEIERANFVIRSPTSPVVWRIGEEVVQRGLLCRYLIGHGESLLSTRSIE